MGSHAVERTTRPDGLECVTIVHSSSGASVEVALFGATVVSYRPSKTSSSVLFVSSQSCTDKSKPIRGGIPIVFPFFSDGTMPRTINPEDEENEPVRGEDDLPSHGFARRLMWELQDSDVTIPSATLRLKSTEETKKQWPFDFELGLTVSLGGLAGNRLITSLHVINTSASTVFKFQALLHTYINTSFSNEDEERSIEGIEIEGLHGTKFVNQPNDREIQLCTSENFSISAEMDNIHINAPNTVVVTTTDKNAAIVVSKTCKVTTNNNEMTLENSDVVVWNPWIAKAERMADFGNKEYRKMVCVEPGVVTRWQKLAPGSKWCLTQTLTAFKN